MGSGVAERLPEAIGTRGGVGLEVLGAKGFGEEGCRECWLLPRCDFSFEATFFDEEEPTDSEADVPRRGRGNAPFWDVEIVFRRAALATARSSAETTVSDGRHTDILSSSHLCEPHQPPQGPLW